MKKLLSVTLAVVMVFATMSVAVFAEDGQKTYPNLMAGVYANNSDCIHASDADVKLKISKEGKDDIIIPLAYDNEMEEYYIEDRVEGIDDIIKDGVGDSYEAWLKSDSEDEIDALAANDYKLDVIIEDNDPNHEFTVDEISIDVMTADTFKSITDGLANMLMALVIEEFEDSGDDVALAEMETMLGGDVYLDEDGTAYIKKGDEETRPIVFNDLLEVIENNKEIMDMEEEDVAAIEEYKTMAAALENGTYIGELIIDVSLKCGCPEYSEYTVYHEYYDAEDKYVGQVSTDLKGAVGDTIKVDDITLVEKYDGKNYSFAGVYLVDSKTGETDFSKPVEEFTIPGYDQGYLEIVVKYVDADGDAAPIPESENNDDKSKAANDKKPGGSPDTGDDFNVLPFAAVMLLAALGMGAAVVRRRA